MEDWKQNPLVSPFIKGGTEKGFKGAGIKEAAVRQLAEPSRKRVI
jgi:hypothetical protein